jgi:hypothetical protein
MFSKGTKREEYCVVSIAEKVWYIVDRIMSSISGIPHLLAKVMNGQPCPDAGGSFARKLADVGCGKAMSN